MTTGNYSKLQAAKKQTVSPTQDEQMMSADDFSSFDKKPEFTGEYFLNAEYLAQIGVPTYKASEGVNRLVFVPNRANPKLWWGKFIYVHYSQGMDNNSWLCPRKHAKEFISPEEISQAMQEGYDPTSCEVCNIWKQYYENKDSVSAANFSLKNRALYYVIDMGSPERILKGPQIYDAPRGKKDGTSGVDWAMRKVLSYEFHNLADLKGKKEFVFTRSGTGPTNTGYSGQIIADRKYTIPDSICEKCLALPPLEDVLVYRDSKHIALKMSFNVIGRAGQDASEPVVEVTPIRKATKQTNLMENLDSVIEELSTD